MADGSARARLLLAATLLFVVLLGGTDAGRYVTFVRAGMAVLGAAFIGLWLVRAPRAADRVDRLVLGALLLFLLACVLSDYPRFSFDAATSATALVAALFVARRVVAEEASRDYALTVLGLMGTTLAVIFVVLWGGVWVRWISLTGSIPPLDLILPVGPYRHYHVVGMTVTLLLPAVMLLARRPVLWPLGWIGGVSSVAIIVMSGSRTVWLALAVVGVVLLVRHAAQLRERITRRVGLLGAAALTVSVAALALVAASPLVARALGTSTIRLRVALWDATLDRWIADPLLGSGPGSFSASITQSDFFSVYDGIGRHADNALIQVLAEAGVLGVGAVALLGAALVIGRGRNMGLAPAAALGLFALMSMTDNPTDSAHLVAIGIVWFALAAPASSTELGPAPTRWIRVPTAVAGLGVGIVASLMLGAAIAYDGAIAAARRGDSPEVVRQLRTASQLDPANALYRRNLAAWLLGTGRGSEAALEIGRAVAQNPADATAWRIAAFAAQSAGDGPTAEDLARRALELRSVDPQNALLLAWLTEDVDDAAEAFDIALRIHPWLTAGAEWEPSFGGSATDRLESALASWSDAPDAASTRWLGSRAWLGAMLSRPLDEEEAGPQNAAVAAVIGCRLDEAAQMAGALQTPPTTNSLLVDILLARASDEAADDAIELAGLRSPRLGYLASVDVPGRSPLVDPEEDLRLYSRNALPTPPIGPIFPTTDSGLSEWLRDPAAAADRGAPDSGLARCR